MRDLFSDSSDPEWNGKADQFVLTRLEVFDWGTFSGLHVVPVAPEGHLFTGKSGSGKSTLLDAHAALLTPPKWKDYNVAAAQEGERRSGDRTDLSYVRGAWAQQTDDAGTLAAQFLRPETTWSAVCEVYQNGRGLTVTLGMLAWVRGKTTAPAEVQRRYLVATRDLPLKDLAFFPESDFDLRQFKVKAPDVTVYSEFSAYGERFRGLLRIEEELALKLLHKTQSAKNLGDLNVFLRDFMLDPPETFAIRDQLVGEFHALKEAHEAVVRARQQIEVLEIARVARTNELEARAEGVLAQRVLEVLPEAFNGVRRGFFARQRDTAQERKSVLTAQRLLAATNRAQVEKEIRALEEQRFGAGGRQLIDWERDIKELELLRDAAMAKRPQLEKACRNVDAPVPKSAEEFAALASRALREVAASGPRLVQAKAAIDEQSQQLWRAGDLLKQAKSQVDEWSKRKTRIEPDLQRIRDDLVRHLGAAEDELPFLGELLEVSADESGWRGAIERVLAGAAVTLLVPPKHYSAVREYVDATNLRNRLRYETEPTWTKLGAEPSTISLVRKVTIKAGTFHTWVDGLLKDRFDYACVEEASELSRYRQAVTRRGQVKQGQHRHEKNDSHALDDPRYWSLGFDNSDKVRLFQDEAKNRAGTYSTLQESSRRAQELFETLTQQGQAWGRLTELAWKEVDAAGPASRIAETEALVKRFRLENPELSNLDQLLVGARASATDLDREVQRLDNEVGAAEKEIADLKVKLLELGSAPPEGIPEDVWAAIPGSVEFPDWEPRTEREIQQRETATRQAVQDRANEVHDKEASARRRLEDQFREFLQRWSEYSGDLRPDAGHAAEFQDLLDKLSLDGLPKFEKHFLDLLTDQSDNNLSRLNTQLDQERRAIRSRLSVVNEGLLDARFNHELGSFLEIKVEDRKLREVAEFRQRISQALGYSLGQNLEQAENRFSQIDALVADLGSSDPEKVRWQKQILDVRQHVEFVARELTPEGLELNVYPSGAGKSGGQRQLLSASVLAAALRYQLGGRDKNLPQFTTVVLDEAFDKADTDFTRSALTTFRRLGFQLILATPGKSLDTIQTFVGGGSLISIQDQKSSSIRSILYDSAERVN